ncbi:uncharacterized protein LOC144883715 [Branchiostoma floridae x Branchiostoma japonicum]
MAGSCRHLCAILALCIFVQTCGQQTSCGAANKTDAVAIVYVFNQQNWVDRLQEVEGKMKLERTSDNVSLAKETCGLSEFHHFPRTDCWGPGSDISSPPGVTLQGCAEACCADSTCLSFQYNIVNQCYLKSRLCSDEEKTFSSDGNIYDRIQIPDIDACLANPCHTKATCSDNPAPALNATCICYPGYIGDGLAKGDGCSGVWLTKKMSWAVNSTGPPFMSSDKGVTYVAATALDGDDRTSWWPVTERYHNNWYILLDLEVPTTLTRIAGFCVLFAFFS